MTKSEFWSKFNVAGDPAALAKIIGIGTAVFFTTITIWIALGHYNATPGHEMDSFNLVAGTLSGAFLGSASALFFDWFVTRLSSPPPTSVETIATFPNFISAIKTELEISQYYRKNQKLKIEADIEYITLTFKAELIPIFPGHPTRVVKQKIGGDSGKDVPKGTELAMDPLYFVGKANLRNTKERIIYNKEDDELQVRYRIIDKEQIEFTDDHYWPSTVMNYDVQFVSDTFEAEFAKVVGRGEPQLLTKTSDSEDTFSGDGSVFAGQILRWRLTKIKT